MHGELQLRGDVSPATTPNLPGTGSRLFSSASLADLQAAAEAMATSGFFPGLKSPGQVLSLMLLCEAEGLHPALAVRRYHVMHDGRITMRADAMHAAFQAAGGVVEWVKLTDLEAEAKFSHKSSPTPISIHWDIARADRAGLLRNPTWRSYARAMLRSRVVSEGVRTVLPAVVMGLHAPDELEELPPSVQAQAAPAIAPPPPVEATTTKPRRSRSAALGEQIAAASPSPSPSPLAVNVSINGHAPAPEPPVPPAVVEASPPPTPAPSAAAGPVPTQTPLLRDVTSADVAEFREWLAEGVKAEADRIWVVEQLYSQFAREAPTALPRTSDPQRMRVGVVARWKVDSQRVGVMIDDLFLNRNVPADDGSYMGADA